MWEKLKRSYPPQLELISLLLVILSSYIAISNYSALPDTIAINFDFMGNPDNWGGKGWIIVVLIVNIASFLSLSLLNILFAILDDPRHFINLPGKRDAMQEMTKEQGEIILASMNRCIFILKIIILGNGTYAAWKMVEIGFGRSSSLGPVVPFFLAAILIVVGYMIWKSIKLMKKPPQVDI